VAADNACVWLESVPALVVVPVNVTCKPSLKVRSAAGGDESRGGAGVMVFPMDSSPQDCYAVRCQKYTAR